MTERDSSITRRQLGRYLREARESTGMTLEDAATLLEWGKSSLQRLEKGQNQKVRSRDLDGLIEIYGIDDGQACGLRGLAQQAAEKSWWHEFGGVIPADFDVYMGLESSARSLVTYQPDLVPGLLQTEDYSRALSAASNPEDSAEEAERRIGLKARRQRLIQRRIKPVTLQVLLFETVLRRIIGGRRAMARQLRHLADLGTRPNVTIRVVPFSAGMPTGDQIGPFVILDFSDATGRSSAEPPVVYAEGYTADMYSEKTSTVQRYQHAYALLWDSSLDEVSSRNLLRVVAREYDSER